MKVKKQILENAFLQFIAIASIVVALSGCATGQSFQEYSQKQSPLPENKTRLYIYRPEPGAGSVKLDIKVDGELVGQLSAKGFLVFDTDSGGHTLTTSTDARRASTFFMKKGEDNYLRIVLKRRFTTNSYTSTVVDPDVGKAEIANTTYSGE